MQLIYLYIGSTPSLELLLQELLVDVAHSYFQLGLLLGLSPNKVQQISVSFPTDIQRCLSHVFIERQKELEPLDWATVVRALVATGHNDVATRIRSKYCEVEPTRSSEVCHAYYI